MIIGANLSLVYSKPNNYTNKEESRNKKNEHAVVFLLCHIVFTRSHESIYRGLSISTGRVNSFCSAYHTCSSNKNMFVLFALIC